MEILGERPVWSMSDSEKLSALDAAVAEGARIQTLIWQLTASLDASGYAKELGACDTARLLSDRYRKDLKDARRDVRLANRLARYPATSTALPDPTIPLQNPAHATSADTSAASDTPTADTPEVDDAAESADGADADGDGADTEDGADREDGVDAGHGADRGWCVSPAQAAAIVSVLDQVPNTVTADDLAVAERELIGLCATHTPSQLRRAGRRIRDLLDPDGAEPDEKAAYDRESLTLKTVDRGVTFNGYLANENAELLRIQINALARPHKTVDGELDPRPLSKRQADALTAILNSQGQPSTAAPRPHTDATPTHTANNAAGATADKAADATADTAAGGDARRSAADDPVPGHGPKPHISVTIDFNDLAAATATATGALIFGDDLSAATVRRLACDAEVLPIVLGSKSQPLDVGTTQRLVTRHMRRALNARDKGCVICGAPPGQTEAHHIIHWADGGPTAITNLALLCKRDHIDLHAGRWQIRILNGIVHVTRPTWTNPTRIPPGKYQPPTAEIVHKPLTPMNPWGEDLPTPPTNPAPAPRPPWDDDPPTPRTNPPPAALGPWGDDDVSAPHPGPRLLVAPDPWGDEPPTKPTKTPVRPEPWGDAAFVAPTGTAP